jgi:hypothetical protein
MPGARAALQMFEQIGKRTRPGQKMRFVYTRGEVDVRPWETTTPIEFENIDKEKYIELLARAACSVFHPFGLSDRQLKLWAHNATIELELGFTRKDQNVRQIHDHDRTTRITGTVGLGRFTARIGN